MKFTSNIWKHFLVQGRQWDGFSHVCQNPSTQEEEDKLKKKKKINWNHLQIRTDQRRFLRAVRDDQPAKL